VAGEGLLEASWPVWFGGVLSSNFLVMTEESIGHIPVALKLNCMFFLVKEEVNEG
jgi:hypothetical protein